MNFRLPNLPEPRAWLVAGWLVAATAGQSAAPTLPVDRLIFGDPASEQQHNVAAPQSETLTGGLGEPARRLLPPATNYWEGGRVSFTLFVGRKFLRVVVLITHLYGAVAQLVRAPDCRSGGCGFEPRRPRHFSMGMASE